MYALDCVHFGRVLAEGNVKEQLFSFSRLVFVVACVVDWSRGIMFLSSCSVMSSVIAIFSSENARFPVECGEIRIPLLISDLNYNTLKWWDPCGKEGVYLVKKEIGRVFHFSWSTHNVRWKVKVVRMLLLYSIRVNFETDNLHSSRATRIMWPRNFAICWNQRSLCRDSLAGHCLKLLRIEKLLRSTVNSAPRSWIRSCCWDVVDNEIFTRAYKRNVEICGMQSLVASKSPLNNSKFF